MSLRLQGPNFFQDVAWTALTEVQPVGDLTRPKWLWGLLIELKGRLTVTVANTGVVTAEAPLTLLNYVRIEGQHKVLGQRQFNYLRGPSIYQYATIFGRGRSGLNVTGGITPSAAAITTAGSPYDFDIMYVIPFPPQGIPLAQQAMFMLKTEDWRTLQVHLGCGDITSIATPGGSTTAFSAFGSGTGSPQMSINTIEPQLGSFRNSIKPALCWRTWLDVTSPVQASNLTDGLLSQLSIGKRYVRTILKQGVLATARSAGVVVFAQNGLADPTTSAAVSPVTRFLIKLDQALIRNPKDIESQKEWYGYALGASQPAGYSDDDFCEGGDIRTNFPAHRLTSANKFELRGDVVAAANQTVEVIEEQIEGNPVYIDRNGQSRTLFQE